MTLPLNVLIHIYNEEYLLPFWLEHHREIFDHGIVVNYFCTDRSMDIVREMCPTWTIVLTRNTHWSVSGMDNEMMDWEKTLDGYKIILNVTEFLFCPHDLRTILPQKKNTNIEIAGLALLSRTKNDCCEVDTLEQLFQSMERVNINDRSPRYLHSYDKGFYYGGRHWNKHPNDKTSCMGPILDKRFKNQWDLKKAPYTPDMFFPAYIGCLSYFPWNSRLIHRKLHTRDHMPENENHHHRWSLETMMQVKDRNMHDSYDISEFSLVAETIEKVLEKIKKTIYK